MLVIPRTKHIESRMLDLPLPFKPVMELKLSSLRASQSSVSIQSAHKYAPARDDGAHGIRLEAVDDDFNHPHLVVTGARPLCVLGIVVKSVFCDGLSLFTITLFTTDARREAAADRTPLEASHVKHAIKGEKKKQM